MAKTSTKTNSNSAERSEPITLGPDKGGNVLAAWQGVYHLFGGKAEGFDVTPEGVIVRTFTTSADYDPATVAEDVSGRTRRVDLIDSYPILQGEEPAGFATSLDMTKWMQQYFRKPGEDGKSPQYVKDAIANYKASHDFPRRKGRPKKTIRIEELGELDESVLAGLNVTELEKLQASINAAVASRNSNS
jgi:hypothetical protein